MHLSSTDRPFTTGDVAEVLNLPDATIKAWSQRGFLSFARHESEVDQLKDGPPDEKDGAFVRRKWARFSEGEVLMIGLFAQLAEIGLPLLFVSKFVDFSRSLILLDQRDWLAVAESGDLIGISSGRSLNALAENFLWYSADGKQKERAINPLMFHVVSLRGYRDHFKRCMKIYRLKNS